MKRYLNPIALFMIATMLTSCVVGKKKFEASENGRLSAEARVRALTSTVNDQNNKISELEATIADLEKKIAELESDTARLNRNIRVMRSLNMAQQDHMDSMLQIQRESLNEMEAMLNSKQDALAEHERTINDLRAIIQSQNDMVSGLLRQVTDALTGFNSDELTVQMRNGKVYVAMSDNLLFRSGSADVDSRGKQALAMLANVLISQPEIDIFIEGHTDNVPIRTSRFTDNWDLSVLRSTSVVRILTVEYNVNPLQIIPSGRSEYFPVDDNSTTDGRAKNRRTEIILAPKLDRLYQMLNEYQAL